MRERRGIDRRCGQVVQEERVLGVGVHFLPFLPVPPMFVPDMMWASEAPTLEAANTPDPTITAGTRAPLPFSLCANLGNEGQRGAHLRGHGGGEVATKTKDDQERSRSVANERCDAELAMRRLRTSTSSGNLYPIL